MNTNISNLMSIVTEEERNLNLLLVNLRSHIYNITIKELNGTENVITDCKEDFQREYEEYLILLDKIAKIKKTIYEKNNEFKLPNGNSIQEALVEVNSLRKKFNMIYEISSYKSENQRITEVNNSYFQYKALNCDAKKLRQEAKAIEDEIRAIEFEISKLNSIEFEIEL